MSASATKIAVKGSTTVSATVDPEDTDTTWDVGGLSRSACPGDASGTVGELPPPQIKLWGCSAGTYTVRLKAGSKELDSIDITVLDRVPKPSSPRVSATSTTSVEFSWDRIAGASRYEVEYRVGSSGSWTDSSDNITGTGARVSHTVISLTCGTNYQFKVRARGDGSAYWGAWGAWTGAVSVTPPCLPPDPSGVTAAMGSPTSVVVSWNRLQGASRYEVEYRAGTSGSWTSDSSSVTGSTTRVSHTVDSLTCGTSYQFRVRSQGDGTTYWGNWGSWGAHVSATPLCAPPAPSGFSAASSDCDSVALGWTRLDGASNYEVSRREGTSGSWTNRRETTAASSTVSGLTTDTSYQFRLRAYGDGSSYAAQWGAAATATATPECSTTPPPTTTPPTTPTPTPTPTSTPTPTPTATPPTTIGLTAASTTIDVGQTTTVTATDAPEDPEVDWEVDDSGVLSIGPCSPGPSGQVGPELPRPKTTVRGCKGGSGEVLLKDSGGTVLGRITITVRGLPPAPANLRVTAFTSSTVSLGWDAVSGTTGYRVEYRTGSGSWSVSATTATSATLEDLSCETSYELTARARGDGVVHVAGWGATTTPSVSATTGSCSQTLPHVTLTTAQSTIDVGATTTVSADLEPTTVNTRWVVSGAVSAGACGPSGSVGPELPPVQPITVRGCQAGTGTVSLATLGGVGLATTTITVLPLAPSPDGLRVTGSTTSTIGLSWDSVTDAAMYSVRRSLDGTTGWTAVGETAGTSTTATGLPSGTTYHFSVRSRGDGSPYSTTWGGWSPSVRGTTGGTAAPTASISASPANPQFGHPVRFSVTVTNAPSGSPSYKWQLRFGSTWADYGTGSTLSYLQNSPLSATARVILTYPGNVTVTSPPLTVTWNVAPVFASSTHAFSVPETAPIGHAVGTTTATDANGDTVTHSITAGNEAGKFAIDSGTGAITVAGTLDRSTTDTYTLTVRASDRKGGRTTATVTITVTAPPNQAPEFASSTYSFTVPENASLGYTVGTTTATDPDGDVVEYAITGGNEADKFAMSTSTGAITVAGTLDRSTTDTYTLTVRASDRNGGTATATVTVAVNRVPTFTTSTYSFIVNEDAAVGDEVGAVSATDPDGDNVDYAFALDELVRGFQGASGSSGGANNPADDFDMHSDGRITVAKTLDHDRTPSYSLTVQASDGRGGTVSATVHIDVNRPPEFTTSTYSYSVYANDPAGRTVGSVGASDPDGDAVTYSIADNRFAINDQGVITVAVSSQLTSGDIELTVTASDRHGASSTATVSVEVKPQPGPSSLRSPLHQMGGLQMWARRTDINPGYCTMSFALVIVADGTERQALSTTAHCVGNREWRQGNAGDSQAVGIGLTPTAMNVVPCDQTDTTCRVGDQSYASATTTTIPGDIFKPSAKNGSMRDDPNPNIDPAPEFFESGGRFRIVASRPPSPGEEVHKVGRSTGWTSGRVTTDGCVPDTRDDGMATVDCAVSALYVSNVGDSGSPVFVTIGSTSAEEVSVALVGVHLAASRHITLGTNTKARFVPIDRVYAESLDRGYDWGPAQMRPVPVLDNLDDTRHETLKPEGTKIVATFLANEFTPSEYKPVLYYVATLFRNGTDVASTSTFEAVAAVEADMIPARRTARFDASEFTDGPRIGPFTVAVKACIDAARTKCGQHGSHGTLEFWLEPCRNGVTVPNPASSPHLVADCETLLSAKSVLEGSGTVLPWRADTAIADWPGVTSTASGITGLDLRNRGLRGIVPWVLADLSELDTLRLGGNALTGCRPRAVGRGATNDLSSLGLPRCVDPPRVARPTATVTGDTVTLTWVDPSQPAEGIEEPPLDPPITGYRIFRRRAPQEPDLAVLVSDTSSTATEYVDSGLLAGSKYIYRVSAITVAGPGERSLNVEAIIPP